MNELVIKNPATDQRIVQKSLDADIRFAHNSAAIRNRKAFADSLGFFGSASSLFCTIGESPHHTKIVEAISTTHHT